VKLYANKKMKVGLYDFLYGVGGSSDYAKTDKLLAFSKKYHSHEDEIVKGVFKSLVRFFSDPDVKRFNDRLTRILYIDGGMVDADLSERVKELAGKGSENSEAELLYQKIEDCFETAVEECLCVLEKQSA